MLVNGRETCEYADRGLLVNNVICIDKSYTNRPGFAQKKAGRPRSR